jgi:hypothetical protein
MRKPIHQADHYSKASSTFHHQLIISALLIALISFAMALSHLFKNDFSSASLNDVTGAFLKLIE